MASVNVDLLVKQLKAYFETDEMVELVAKMKEGGFKLSKITTGLALAWVIVEQIEKFATDMSEAVPGSDKRDAAVKFLDDIVDVPFFLEPIDGTIIGMGVDAIVLIYNTRFGHGWIEKIKNWLL